MTQDSSVVNSDGLRVSGPRGLPFVGHLPALSRDPLGFFRRCANEYGGIVEFPVLQYRVFLLTDPALIQEVLQTQASQFVKSADYRSLRSIFGNGLLTAEGSDWLRQRRMLQPSFNHDSLHRYFAIMRQCTENMLDGWRPGQVRNVYQDMMALTLEIVARTLFETEVPDRIDLISKAVSAVFRDLSAPAMFIPALKWIPTARNIRWHRAIRRLHGIMERMIHDARQHPERSGGMLAMLLAARDAEGQALSDEQIRDELLTIFLAGHETTAVSLSWTLYLISRNPRVAQKILEEIASAGPLTDMQVLLSLRYVRAVLQESLRLYPPVWSIGREAASDVKLGDSQIPKGAQIWICQWIVHHDERYYSAPDEFRPERWLNDNANPSARLRYLPFGAGSRMCIGQSFAVLEATVILALLMSRFSVTLAPDANVEPAPWITLRPRHGIPLILSDACA